MCGQKNPHCPIKVFLACPKRFHPPTSGNAWGVLFHSLNIFKPPFQHDAASLQTILKPQISGPGGPCSWPFVMQFLTHFTWHLLSWPLPSRGHTICKSQICWRWALFSNPWRSGTTLEVNDLLVTSNQKIYLICRSCLWGNRVISIIIYVALCWVHVVTKNTYKTTNLHMIHYSIRRCQGIHTFPCSAWYIVDLVNATQERSHLQSDMPRIPLLNKVPAFFSENRKHTTFCSPPPFQNDRNDPHKTKHRNSVATSLMHVFCKASYAT